MRFNGNPPFPFKIHVIQHLVMDNFRQGPGALEHPIRQGRLAVVDVCDDAKISDFICLHILEAEHLFQVKITATQRRKQIILLQ